MADPAGASRSRRAARSTPKGVLASTVPAPPAVLHIAPVTWKAGTALHRVHLDVYAADAFNPGIKGNAKFSPIVNAVGKPIPICVAVRSCLKVGGPKMLIGVGPGGRGVMAIGG